MIAILVGLCRSTAHTYHKWKRVKEELKKIGLNSPTLGVEVDTVASRAYSEAEIEGQMMPSHEHYGRSEKIAATSRDVIVIDKFG